MMVAPTPVVVSHQGTYGSPGRFSILSEIKKNVTRFSQNICCSQAVQSHISDKGVSDLIDAMEKLGQAGFRPRLSIVGDGEGRSRPNTRRLPVRCCAKADAKTLFIS